MSSSGKGMGALEIVVGTVLEFVPGGQSVGTELIMMGVMTELSILLMPTPSTSGQDGIIRSSVAAQQILYGQVCTGGVLCFANSYGSNGSNTNAFLVVCIGHSLTRANSAGTAGMAVEGIQGYYINNVYVPVYQAGVGGWNPGRGYDSGTGPCAIIQGTNQPWNPLATNLWISFSDGSQTTPDAVIQSNFGSVDNNFIGYGICYSTLVMFMSADQGTFTGAFPSGINTPDTVKAVIAGQKIYDPRLDTDNGGSGSQRLNDSTTWTFSSNPALIAADYLTRSKNDGGCGYNPGTYSGSTVINSQVNWPSIAAAANICDENVTVPAYGATWNGSVWSGTDTISRYTFNGCIDTAQNVDQNLHEIIKTMAGFVVVAGGQIYINAGATIASSGDIDETFFVPGTISLQPQVQRNQMFNAVKMTYGSEPQADYNNAQGMPIINSTYETQDGGAAGPVRLWFNDTIKGCNNQFSCQILEIIKSKQSRNKQVLRAKCNLKMLAYQAGDVVDMTISELSLSAAPFRIMQYQMNSDLSISVVMVQENSGVYDLPATPDGTYQAYDVSSYQSLYDITPSAPGAPSSLSASALAAGNLVQWVPPAPSTYDYIKVYRSSTSPGSSGYSEIAAVVGDSFLDTNVVNGTQYWYYVVAVNFWNAASATPSLPVAGANCISIIAAANATRNTYQGAYVGGATYAIYDQVNYTDGNMYQSLQNANTGRTPPSNPTWWVLIGPANLDAVANGATYGKVVLTALTSGNIDFSKSGFANKNLDNISDTATYNRHSTLEFDGLHFYDHSAAQNANSQASYKSAVTGSQQNLVPDSDIKYGIGGGTYWKTTGTLWQWYNSASYGNGPYSFLVYGTGATFSGSNKFISTKLPIANGVTYTFSFNISGTGSITGGTSVPISIINQGTSTTYASVTINSALGDGRHSVTFTASASDVPIIMMNLSGLQISSGAHLTIGQFQLELGSKMTGYRSSDDFYGYGVYAGSGPVSIPTASFTYTSSCPSGVGKITWSWSGMGYYNADGSETTIANGSNTQTSSLAASTTYYFYPYVNLPSSTTTILWMAGGTGSTGYAYTAKSAAAAAGQNNATNIPLSSGGMAAATPASGGGGGGGGGGFGCLHPSTPITINGRVQPARNLHVGDLILTPDGEQEVTKIRRSPNREWRRIRFTDEEILVTPSHRFLLPDGGLIAAEDLRVKELIQGSKALAVVTGIDYYEEAAEMVSLEVKGGYYLARAGGAVNKNGTIKP